MGRKKSVVLVYGALIVALLSMSGCGGANNGGAVSVPSVGNGSSRDTDSGTVNTDVNAESEKHDIASSVTVTVTWNAPSTRTDGSSLNPATDLSTYKLYYGTASRAYTHAVDIPNPGTSIITHTLNLPSGTYYFSVTDVDTLGQESGYAPEVSKSI